MTGGWEFVRAAYLVAYGSLTLYGCALVWRARRALRMHPKCEPRL